MVLIEFCLEVLEQNFILLRPSFTTLHILTICSVYVKPFYMSIIIKELHHYFI